MTDTEWLKDDIRKLKEVVADLEATTADLENKLDSALDRIEELEKNL